MGTRRAAFTQLDVQRAFRGAQAAGIQPEELRISPQGEIRILCRRREGPTDTSADVLDEIDRHFGHGDR